MDFRGPLMRFNSSTHSRAAKTNGGAQRDVCSSRSKLNKKWRDELDRYFSEVTVDGIPSFAVVLTLNNGFWDFFVNWQQYFIIRVMSKSNNQPLLIIIAEDSSVYEKLKKLTPQQKKTTVVLPGHDFANESVSDKAEDYDSQEYKSLVSSRATHLLNLMCSLEGGESDSVTNETSSDEGTKAKKENMVIVYSDTDTVWLKDPFPYIQSKMFGSNENDGTQTQQQSKYDLLVAVDDHNYNEFDAVVKFDDYYCTGYLAIAQTPASIEFLSHWEKELQANPQLNQPLFNSLLRSKEIPKVRHGGLSETKFPPGRLYFDEWVNEGGEEERRKKEETIVVHNNYIIGFDAKKQRFQDHDLWMNAFEQK